MKEIPQLSGPVRKPRSGGTPKQLVILLHGWGADGANLIDLAEVMGQALPDAQFIAPNAPFICEVNPYGYQWFSLMDRQPQHMLDGVSNAASIFNAFVDAELKKLSLDNSKLAFIGFSQGTMTALHTALRRTPPIAGLVGFSGMLIAPDLLAKEAKAQVPVCLIHGDMDEVVPFKSLATATDALKAQKYAVESHARPRLGHSIDMQGLQLAADFLQKCFSR